MLRSLGAERRQPFMAGTLPKREQRSRATIREPRQRACPLTAARAEGSFRVGWDGQDVRRVPVFPLAAALCFQHVPV